MTGTLHTICEARRTAVAQQKRVITEQSLYAQALAQTMPRGFHRSLKQVQAKGQAGLIAEIKKASPSRGLIRADFDVPALAQAYQEGGATCLSVLTEPDYFKGDAAYLSAARQATHLPVLRKDFIVDAYHVLESRALGADCILLIVAALEDTQLREFTQIAHDLGMDALVEVHDEAELARALNSSASTLIGINNRNLTTLTVDLATSENLRPQIPETHTVVCESGIATHADILRMRSHGLQHFLVGESLMREADVTRATRVLLGLSG